MLDQQSILRNYQRVREYIERHAEACRRDPLSIQLIAVSKTHPAAAINCLIEAGHRDFGENYANELISKAEELRGSGARWHFIGRLQSNKFSRLIPEITSIHALTSVEHAASLAKNLATLPGRNPLAAYIAINMAGEANKTGIDLDAAPLLAERIKTDFPEIVILGLMAVPPVTFNDDNYAAGTVPDEYLRLRAVAQTIGHGQLSLGMSADMRIAIAAGSTCLRIGTAIFGERRRS